MIKKDDNGNLVIPSWFLVIVGLAIAMISTVSAVVAAGVTVKKDVEYLQIQVEELTPVIRDNMEDFEDRLVQSERVSSILDTRLENIEKNLDYIRDKVEGLT